MLPNVKIKQILINNRPVAIRNTPTIKLKNIKMKIIFKDQNRTLYKNIFEM